MLSWGNSFGYLVPAETARSLAGMRRGAAAGRPARARVGDGRRVATSPAASKPSDEWEFGGIRMRAENHYRREREPARERVHVFEDADGHVEHARAAHHVHTSGEVVRMLRAAGFGEVELLAGDGVAPYELGSPRLIAVARCIPERSG